MFIYKSCKNKEEEEATQVKINLFFFNSKWDGTNSESTLTCHARGKQKGRLVFLLGRKKRSSCGWRWGRSTDATICKRFLPTTSMSE